MPTTIPKPKILGPKIPSVVALGLLAAQFLFLNQGNDQEAACTLKIDRAHISKSVPFENGLGSIKINVMSKCNEPQKSTKLDINILKIENNQELIAYTFKNQIRLATLQNQSTVKFLDLFRQCSSNAQAMYSGEAQGEVLLKSGKRIPISGKSDKFVALECTIKAK